jgi:hypothetical protein
MPAIRVDNTDLFPYTRVGRGEGLQPAPGDVVEAQFGDTAGDGDPLVGITRHNREFLVPVHLRPKVEGNLVTLTNLLRNPTWESSDLGDVRGSAGGTTRGRSSLAAYVYGPGQGYRWTDLTAGDVSFGNVYLDLNANGVDFACSPGDLIGLKVMHRANVAVGLRWQINWNDGTVVTSDEGGVALGVYTKHTHSVRVPAGVTGFWLRIWPALNVGAGSEGGDIDVDEIFIGTLPEGFTDAQIPTITNGGAPGWSWEGTPHQSRSSGPSVLAAVPVNCVENPSAESDLAGAGTAGLDTVASITSALSRELRPPESPSRGEYVFRCVCSAAGPGNFGFRLSGVSQRLIVQPGETYYLSCLPTVIPPGKTLKMAIQFWRSDGGGAASHTSAATSTVFERLRMTGTVPNNAVAAHIEVYVVNGVRGDKFEADDFLLGYRDVDYFDGDGLDAYFVGERHRSMSIQYAGKKGLHLMVQKLNRLLADGARLRWQDSGTDTPTDLDLLFGRFEPDFDYRKAKALWLSGVVRLVTDPLGSTGTSRVVGTAGGTGVALPVTLPLIAGDAPALLDVTVRAGSHAVPGAEGRILGAAVVPAGYAYEWPAASIVRLGGAALSGGGADTYVLATAAERTVEGIGRIDLWPASLYPGRHRILAIANTRSRYHALQARGPDGELLGPAAVPSVVRDQGGYGTVDLGVLSVPSSTPRATLPITLELAWREATDQGLPGNTYGDLQLHKLLVLPEDSLALAVDVERRGLALGAWQSDATPAIPAVDLAGNPLDAVGGLASHGLHRVAGGLTLPSQSIAFGGLRGGALKIGHPTAADLTLEVETSMPLTASRAFFIGRMHNASNGDGIYAQFSYGTGASGYYALSILANGPGVPGKSTPSLLASKAVPAIVGADVLGLTGIMAMRLQGGRVDVELQNELGAPMATLSASQAVRAGQAVVGAIGTHAGEHLIRSYRIAEVPSRPLGPRDSVQFDDVNESTLRRSSASGVNGDLAGKRVGGRLTVQPTSGMRVVGLQLPVVAGAPQDGLLDVEVRVRERFTYAR